MGLFDRFSKKSKKQEESKPRVEVKPAEQKIVKKQPKINEPFDMEVIKEFREERKKAMREYDDPNHKPEPVEEDEKEIKITLNADEFERVLERFEEISHEEAEKSRYRTNEINKWQEYINKNNREAEQYLYAGDIDKATECFEKNISALDITTISYSYLDDIYTYNEDYENELRICDQAIDSLRGSPYRKYYIAKRSEVQKIINNQGTFSDNTELYKIIKQEEKFHIKGSIIKDYYQSDEYKADKEALTSAKKEYLENNPKDFLIVGTKIYSRRWSELYSQSKEELELLANCGGGRYLEDQERYEDALVVYERANNIAKELYPNNEETLVDKRINVCKNKIKKQEIKQLEAEAKEMEKTDPKEAIELYNKLNVLNPNLKKYDKRIEILNNKINK